MRIHVCGIPADSERWKQKEVVRTKPCPTMKAFQDIVSGHGHAHHLRELKPRRTTMSAEIQSYSQQAFPKLVNPFWSLMLLIPILGRGNRRIQVPKPMSFRIDDDDLLSNSFVQHIPFCRDRESEQLSSWFAGI